MADNVILDSMSGGETVSTDYDGTAHHQYVKLEFGADNTQTKVDASNPLPVSAISGTMSINTPGTITSGTVSVNTPGTITSGTVSINAGTIGAGTINTMGTLTNLAHGTIESAGTVTGVGVVSALTSGTVSVNTNATVASGSIAVTAGTVTLASPGTITSGTIAINAGTIGGKAASGAASVANPVQIAGTDSGGTIYSPLINTAGAIGSVANAGTVKEVTTVANVSHGTIENSGTVTGVGVVSSITAGTVAINAGTVGGKAASGAASVANPVLTAGTDSGGTVYSPRITTTGAIGSIAAVAQVHNAGTIAGGTIGILTDGTIRVAAGTLNAGTINAGTVNTGTINSGTINVGTISPVPSKMISIIGSVWGTNSATAGTLVAAPTGGSAIYLNEVSITNEGTSTLTAGMGFGTAQQGTTVVVRAAMAGNGGIEKGFPVATTGGGTQAPLVMWTTGSGTAFFNASYFIAL